MKRNYTDGVKEDIDFFVGKEVEKTKTKGKKSQQIRQNNIVVTKATQKNGT